MDEISERGPAKVCPRCRNQTLHLEPKKGRVICTHCGYEEFVATQQ